MSEDHTCCNETEIDTLKKEIDRLNEDNAHVRSKSRHDLEDAEAVIGKLILNIVYGKMTPILPKRRSTHSKHTDFIIAKEFIIKHHGEDKWKEIIGED